MKPNVLRNNRWRCDHGWDVDLDDGSTNYHIYNNLCLHGGIKLREGFGRVCENNVMVDNSLHAHVWFKDGGDVVRHNIVFTPYHPIGVPRPWGRECDFNLLHHPGRKGAEPAVALQKQSGRDEHSLEADALFLDPKKGDYSVAAGSPALKLGFRNFTMDQFGVQKPGLKKIARTPALPGGGDAPKAGETSGATAARRDGSGRRSGTSSARTRFCGRPARRGWRLGRRGGRRRRREDRAAQDGRDPRTQRAGDEHSGRFATAVRRRPTGAAGQIDRLPRPARDDGRDRRRSVAMSSEALSFGSRLNGGTSP